MNEASTPLDGASRLMNEPNAFGSFLYPIEGIAKIVVALSTALIVIFTLGQVADRYILKGTFNAYDQIARIGLIWMTFVGATMALRERTNIVVDLVDSYLPPRIVAMKAVILDVLSIVLMTLLMRYGLRLLEVGSFQSVMGTPFTYWEVYLSLVVGCALFLVFLLARVAAAAFLLMAPGRRGNAP